MDFSVKTRAGTAYYKVLYQLLNLFCTSQVQSTVETEHDYDKKSNSNSNSTHLAADDPGMGPRFGRGTTVIASGFIEQRVAVLVLAV